MKIEHWRCQSRYSNLQLNYYNLLGTCHGLGPSGVAHCDTSKGDRDISRNPAEAPDQINGMMRFQVSGRVECDDIVFGTEIDQVLNLNARHLINARRGVLDLFKLNLGKKTASRNKLEKLLTIWDGTGNTSDLRPFCQVVVYWLRNASNASKPLHS